MIIAYYVSRTGYAICFGPFNHKLEAARWVEAQPETLAWKFAHVIPTP